MRDMIDIIANIAQIRRYLLLVVFSGVLFWAPFTLAQSSSTSDSSTAEAATPLAASLAADSQTYQILTNSCFDCHSNASSGSLTGKFAPSSMFGGGKGREALNFANWAAMDAKQRAAMASAIITTVNSGNMPPSDYDFLHPSAKLNDTQKKILVDWASKQTLPAH